MFLIITNTSEAAFDIVVENFMSSLAGYCVATYVLGIGVFCIVISVHVADLFSRIDIMTISCVVLQVISSVRHCDMVLTFFVSL
jgi:hypothetical protein